jgi:hypothetical protein
MALWKKNNSSYSNDSAYKQKSLLPRMLWARKDWDLKKLHLNVFKQIRHLIAEWIDYKDPKTTKEADEEFDLR